MFLNSRGIATLMLLLFLHTSTTWSQLTTTSIFRAVSAESTTGAESDSDSSSSSDIGLFESLAVANTSMGTGIAQQFTSLNASSGISGFGDLNSSSTYDGLVSGRNEVDCCLLYTSDAADE